MEIYASKIDFEPKNDSKIELIKNEHINCDGNNNDDEIESNYRKQNKSTQYEDAETFVQVKKLEQFSQCVIPKEFIKKPEKSDKFTQSNENKEVKKLFLRTVWKKSKLLEEYEESSENSEESEDQKVFAQCNELKAVEPFQKSEQLRDWVQFQESKESVHVKLETFQQHEEPVESIHYVALEISEQCEERKGFIECEKESDKSELEEKLEKSEQCDIERKEFNENGRKVLKKFVLYTISEESIQSEEQDKSQEFEQLEGSEQCDVEQKESEKCTEELKEFIENLTKLRDINTLEGFFLYKISEQSIQYEKQNKPEEFEELEGSEQRDVEQKESEKCIEEQKEPIEDERKLRHIKALEKFLLYTISEQSIQYEEQNKPEEFEELEGSKPCDEVREELEKCFEELKKSIKDKRKLRYIKALEKFLLYTISEIPIPYEEPNEFQRFESEKPEQYTVYAQVHLEDEFTESEEQKKENLKQSEEFAQDFTTYEKSKKHVHTGPEKKQEKQRYQIEDEDIIEDFSFPLPRNCNEEFKMLSEGLDSVSKDVDNVIQVAKIIPPDDKNLQKSYSDVMKSFDLTLKMYEYFTLHYTLLRKAKKMGPPADNLQSDQNDDIINCIMEKEKEKLEKEFQ